MMTTTLKIEIKKASYKSGLFNERYGDLRCRPVSRRKLSDAVIASLR